ncbi:hypothetical protein HK097_009136 [Rhizophlyctis rosea]|uniref:Uncharacterized protein n=1 Tax=Rhizophlyctis rosea TaxID=64517 RepID=A0AAD5X1A3_9FUNG|nr:hypothetical protein HK097_009136 [Rhizophlyctis rosea]
MLPEGEREAYLSDVSKWIPNHGKPFPKPSLQRTDEGGFVFTLQALADEYTDLSKELGEHYRFFNGEMLDRIKQMQDRVKEAEKKLTAVDGWALLNDAAVHCKRYILQVKYKSKQYRLGWDAPVTKVFRRVGGLFRRKELLRMSVDLLAKVFRWIVNGDRKLREIMERWALKVMKGQDKENTGAKDKVYDNWEGKNPRWNTLEDLKKEWAEEQDKFLRSMEAKLQPTEMLINSLLKERHLYHSHTIIHAPCKCFLCFVEERDVKTIMREGQEMLGILPVIEETTGLTRPCSQAETASPVSSGGLINSPDAMEDLELWDTPTSVPIENTHAPTTLLVETLSARTTIPVKMSHPFIPLPMDTHVKEAPLANVPNDTYLGDADSSPKLSDKKSEGDSEILDFLKEHLKLVKYGNKLSPTLVKHDNEPLIVECDDPDESAQEAEGYVHTPTSESEWMKKIRSAEVDIVKEYCNPPIKSDFRWRLKKEDGISVSAIVRQWIKGWKLKGRVGAFSLSIREMLREHGRTWTNVGKGQPQQFTNRAAVYYAVVERVKDAGNDVTDAAVEAEAERMDEERELKVVEENWCEDCRDREWDAYVHDRVEGFLERRKQVNAERIAEAKPMKKKKKAKGKARCNELATFYSLSTPTHTVPVESMTDIRKCVIAEVPAYSAPFRLEGSANLKDCLINLVEGQSTDSRQITEEVMASMFVFLLLRSGGEMEAAKRMITGSGDGRVREGVWGKSHPFPFVTAETLEGYGNEIAFLIVATERQLRKVDNLFRQHDASGGIVYTQMLFTSWMHGSTCAPFTTTTINFGWPSGIHVDRGDYRRGYCTVTPVGKWKGCELWFPQFDCQLDMCAGDVCFFKSSLLWHGNLPLIEGIRFSFVYFSDGGMMEKTAKTINCGTWKFWVTANGVRANPLYRKDGEEDDNFTCNGKRKASSARNEGGKRPKYDLLPPDPIQRQKPVQIPEGWDDLPDMVKRVLLTDIAAKRRRQEREDKERFMKAKKKGRKVDPAPWWSEKDEELAAGDFTYPDMTPLRGFRRKDREQGPDREQGEMEQGDD